MIKALYCQIGSQAGPNTTTNDVCSRNTCMYMYWVHYNGTGIVEHWVVKVNEK